MLVVDGFRSLLALAEVSVPGWSSPLYEGGDY